MLRRLVNGFRGPRSLRQERVSGGSQSIARPTAPPPRLRHPIALVAIGAGLSGALVFFLAHGRIARTGAGGTELLRVVIGSALLVLIVNGLTFSYLRSFRRGVLASRAKVSLIALLSLLVCGTAWLYALSGNWPPYLLPVTLATVVLAVVFDRRLALEVSGLLLLYVGLLLVNEPGASAEGIVRTIAVLAAGVLVAVLTTGRIRTRGKIIRIGALIGLVQVAVIGALTLMSGAPESPAAIVEALFWGLGHGVLVGFVVSGSLPMVEHLFGISTDISLLELSNIAQQTVLRRLLVAAPGTYNHSFIVGMLAEEAAEALGANPLLARVGGYYHDIGKMMKPEYYGENEVIPGLHHRDLTPTMSTLIIKAHVKDGSELAKHHDLPGPIIDIIEQHHGTTLVEFFFAEAKKRARKKERVEESVFRYEGPKPQTREAGIVMLADSVEAATRSLSDPTPARIESTIRSISTKKLSDGQLDECGLTLKEVRLIEDSFIRVLAGIFHRRPRYPEIARSRVREARAADRESPVSS